jgi:hypothetical protein
MKAVMSFFKSNKLAVVLVLTVVAVLSGASLMVGCGLGDMIRHDVPKDMQAWNEGEAKVSVNEAPFVLESYLDDVERNVTRFSAANERAMLVFQFANSLVTVGLEELGNSPIPGASIASGLLLGIAGLMTRKPGTAKEVAKEKMASYNKGVDMVMEQMKNRLSEEAVREMLKQIKEASE